MSLTLPHCIDTTTQASCPSVLWQADAWHPQRWAVVVIPAKDEADSLPATLAALAAQTDAQGRPLTPNDFEVLLLANNCQDTTAAVGREFGRQHPGLAVHVAELALPAREAHVGRARRLLMDAACRRLQGSRHPRAFIASTDADTCVAPTWLATIRAEVQAGADAVGGRILTHTTDPACPVRRCQLLDATYQVLRSQLEHLLDPDEADPWPRHHQHFGASLAVTVEGYQRVGGLPVVPYLEDEALFQALRRHDLRVRHSPQVRVYTSSRQQGRVAVGLSWQLREWAGLLEDGNEPLVDHPVQLISYWQNRCRLRKLWRSAQAGAPVTASVAACGPVAAALLLPSYDLWRKMRQCPSFGELWEWVEARRRAKLASHGPWPQLPLRAAVAVLRQEIARLAPCC